MKRTLLLLAVLGLFSAIPGFSGKEIQVLVCHHPAATPHDVNLVSVPLSQVGNHIPNHPFDTQYDGSCQTVYFF